MGWLIIPSLFVLSFFFCGVNPARERFTDDHTSSQDSITVEELLEFVDEFIFTEPERAMEYAEQMVSLSKETGNLEGEIKGLYNMGEIYIRQGDLDLAKSYLDDGLHKSQELNHRILTAQGHYHLSRWFEGKSDYGEALIHLENALAIYEDLDSKTDIARAQNSFGRIYQELGNYTEALKSFFEALRLNDELGRKVGMAVSYTNIGRTYMLNSRYDEAIQFLNESLAIDEANNDLAGMMINKLNIGASYQRKEEYETALEYHREALEIARELNYKTDEAILLGNIGSTYRKQGFPEIGLPYLFDALDIMRETDYNFAATLNNISEAYLSLENFLEALEYANEAMETSQNRNDLNRLQVAYFNMASAYEGLGDFENANKALKLYNTTRDSLFSLEKERQINELQVVYDIGQRDRRIEILTLEAETAEFRRNTYLAAGIMVSLILFLLYNRQRLKSRKNHQLFLKEHEVAEMKSNFFSNISHEFRTPLTLISGPIQLLREEIGPDDHKVQSQLKTMDRNVNRLLSLINQLLDLSKLESGKLSLSVANKDMVSVVRGVTMAFESLAEMKQIELSINADPDHLEMYFDLEKVETILINLLTNAFNFTPEMGKIEVNLSVSGEEYCKISVRDSGSGIPEEDLSNIFDRFYQSIHTRDGQYAGSGIGLALTKELVDLHKGKIRVESSEGEGAEFTVMLPLGAEYFSEQELAINNVRERDENIKKNVDLQGEVVEDLTEELSASNPVILLIEDNTDVMNYLKDIVGERYRVLEEMDGDAGISTALETIPDLIISDVMMPGKNGFEVCESLKNDEKTSHVPVILLTAKASHEDRMEGLMASADEYLTKPFVPKELLVKVENLIESRKKLREKYKREFMLKPGKIEVHSMDEAFLLRVREAVDKHLDDEGFTVERLGKEVGMSRSQIHRKLIALIDQSATEFIRTYRLNRAMDMIKKKAGSISEVAYSVGFNSPSYFSKSFRREFGISPSEVEEDHS